VAKRRLLERTRGSKCGEAQAGIMAQRFSHCYLKGGES